MPAQANRRAADGPEGFAWGLARIACAQVLYAQAEQSAEASATKNKGSFTARSASGRKGVTNASETVPASAVYTSETVVDALADIAATFVSHVGARSAARANLGGRTHVTFTDVFSTFRVMSSVTQTHTADLARYIKLYEVPFPMPVPAFPLAVTGLDHVTTKEVAEFAAKQNGNLSSADENTGMSGPDESLANGLTGESDQVVPSTKRPTSNAPVPPPWIEPWIPALPPARTYISTPGVILNDGKPPDRSVLSLQRRQAELSLTRLVQPKEPVSPCSDIPQSQNPFTAPPKVDFGKMIEENMAAKTRDILEPADESNEMRDSNLSSGRRAGRYKRLASGASGGTITEGNRDPKRARVQRIFAEAAGAANPTAPSPAASPGRTRDQSDVANDRVKGSAGVKGGSLRGASSKNSALESANTERDAPASQDMDVPPSPGDFDEGMEDVQD